MHIPTIIFSKISLTENSNKILFCIEGNKLLELDCIKSSPTEFSMKNSLIRQDKFDWHVNKNKPICFLFEKIVQKESELPLSFHGILLKDFPQWLTFPQAIKKITDGKKRNLLQLAVQYISYGAIDESVIAADYDEGFLKQMGDLLKKE